MPERTVGQQLSEMLEEVERRDEDISRLEAEIQRLERFIRERVADRKHMYTRAAGYHARRVCLEAERILTDPEYFPGSKGAEEE